MVERVILSLLACMAGIQLCFYLEGLRPRPSVESSGILGKVNCTEVEEILRTAPPEFRPTNDEITSIADRCNSQEALSLND